MSSLEFFSHSPTSPFHFSPPFTSSPFQHHDDDAYRHAQVETCQPQQSTQIQQQQQQQQQQHQQHTHVQIQVQQIVHQSTSSSSSSSSSSSDGDGSGSVRSTAPSTSPSPSTSISPSFSTSSHPLNKSGRPIKAASIKRQLRRQKQRARTEPKLIELADGQVMNLGRRRSRYAAALEKLNADLASITTQLQQQQQQNQQLKQHIKQLSKTQAASPHFIHTLQDGLHRLTSTKSQLMHHHSSATLDDFFMLSSPVMLVVLDFNFRVLDANATYLRENGWTRAELIGRRLPIMQMCMFFIPGYDPKKIPIDENDIPPLHGGLPIGLSPAFMRMNPDNYPIYHQFFQGDIDTVRLNEVNIDGKGRLFQSTMTHWLAYLNPNTNTISASSPSLDALTLSLPVWSDVMMNNPLILSEPILSQPTTQADRAFMRLIAKSNPPFNPSKGYPKYFCVMESMYEREYFRVQPSAKSHADSQPPLARVAQIAEQFTIWRRATLPRPIPRIVNCTNFLAHALAREAHFSTLMKMINDMMMNHIDMDDCDQQQHGFLSALFQQALKIIETRNITQKTITTEPTDKSGIMKTKPSPSPSQVSFDLFSPSRTPTTIAEAIIAAATVDTRPQSQAGIHSSQISQHVTSLPSDVTTTIIDDITTATSTSTSLSSFPFPFPTPFPSTSFSNPDPFPSPSPSLSPSLSPSSADSDSWFPRGTRTVTLTSSSEQHFLINAHAFPKPFDAPPEEVTITF